jgi:diguanylate cyclase (GGDEF)-like protein
LFSNEYVKWSEYKSRIYFEHISVEQGLSQSSVFAIALDKYGFLWFGTENGLNRYDGYTIKIYKREKNNLKSLSSNQIHSLYKDSNNNLWVGTFEGGLNLYNYKKDNFIRFTYKKNDDSSISGNDINLIYEDSKGNIWVGTDGYGLNLIIKKDKRYYFKRFLIDRKNDDGSPIGAEIYDMFEDKENNLWIATFDRGLLKARYEGNILKIINQFYPQPDKLSMEENKMTAINSDKFGMLWIGTTAGLLRFNPKTKKIEKFKKIPKNPNSLSHNYIRRIYKDKKDILWIGTDGGGLNKLELGKNPRAKPSFLIIKHDLKFTKSLSSNAIESIFEDNNGVLWVGTYLGGVNKLILHGSYGKNREKSPFIHYQTIPFDNKSLSNNFVNTFLEDNNGILWIGTDGGGLNRVNPPKNKKLPLSFFRIKKSANGLTDNVITALYQDSKNQIWLGTYRGGLLKIVKGTEYSNFPRFNSYRFSPDNPNSISSDFIMSIYEDKSGVLWIGTIDGGLCRYNSKNNNFTRFQAHGKNGEISDNSIFVIYEDRKGNLWVGTSDGLNLFNKKTEKFRKFLYHKNDLHSINDNFITTITEDKYNNLWVGTLSGLNRIIKIPDNFDDEIFFERYDENKGFPPVSIHGIIKDGDSMWISTPSGLFEFNNKKQAVKEIGLSSGLFITEFRRDSFYKSKKGDIFLGSGKGFVIFDPKKISVNKVIPPVVILDVKLFNKSLKPGEKVNGKILIDNSILEKKVIELPYRKYVITFEFAALHYVNPTKNMYAYKMEGIEKKFNFVENRRFATYSFLPPGEYTFKVIASNSSNIWNKEGVSLKIIIIPPFYMTKTFYFLALVFILFLFYSIYKYRVRALTKRKKILEKLVQQRTQELEEVNDKLAKLATHDELTGLTNFRKFKEVFNLEWRRMCRAKKPLSIIMIDIDFFKKYNDTYGHLMGNDCLRKISEVLKTTIRRPGDMVARYGGEEFVVVLSETRDKGAVFVAERIRSEVEKLKIIHEKSTVSRFVTVSLGVSTIIPQEKFNPQELIEQADEALYKSKKTGRNRITFFSRKR